MLQFKTITLQDRPWVQEILYHAGRKGCEYSFCNLFFWMSRIGKVARHKDVFLCRLDIKGKTLYLFPAGQGDLTEAVDLLRQDAGDAPFVLRGVTEEDKAFLEVHYPQKFTFTPLRNTFDYLYPVEKLADLAGKKLQAKRNHIHRFEENHPQWHTEEITRENLHLCEELTRDWYAQRPDEDFSAEKAALFAAFQHREELGLEGILLFDGEKPVAFSMGNRITEEMFDVNFEKAHASIQGAYPMVNREFARRVREKYPAVKFLNREDDMGLEGLRKAKESYYPDLLRKYEARWEA